MPETRSHIPETRSSDRTRGHVLRLLSLLASRVDTAARHETLRQIADREGMRAEEQLFAEMARSDRSHIDWLRKEALRSILGP